MANAARTGSNTAMLTRLVKFHVTTAVHQFEIPWAIVQFISVFMMDYFRWLKATAKCLFHDPTMLQFPASKHLVSVAYPPRPVRCPFHFQRIAINSPKFIMGSTKTPSLMPSFATSDCASIENYLGLHKASVTQSLVSLKFRRMSHIGRILLFLALSSPVHAQVIVTPVAGVATVDLNSCGQGGGSPNPTCTFKLTLTANTTLAFNNVFSGANLNLFVNPGTFTLTWPASVPTTPILIASQNNFVPLRYDGTSGSWLLTIAGGGINSQNGPGPIFNVKGYGAIGDAQHITDGSTTGTGARNTVTSATAHFQTRAKVGQNIVCAAFGNSIPLMPISAITAVTSDTVVTTNGTDAGTASGLKCIWWTPSATGDDTAAFQAANAAANATTGSIDPNTGVTYGTPGTVYCPSGGYAVKGRIFNAVGTVIGIPPSFKGEQGKNHCIIYMIPGLADPGDGFAVLVNSYSNIGFDMEDITIDGLGFGNTANHPIVQCQACTQFTIKRVKITNTATSGANNGTIDFRASSAGSTEDILIQGGNGLSGDFACSFSGAANGIVNRNMNCSNHNQNLLIDNGGGTPRSIAGDNGVTFIGGFNDECGSGVNCAVLSNGAVGNFHDFTFMQSAQPTNYALSVDGTSRAYLSNVSCGIFGSTTGTTNCLQIASGGYVTATNSDLRGNDANSTAGVAVNGPANASFVDLGGNKILHSVSGVISPVTIAQYATLGFTGGIVPKSTQTHTPNTCYAVTGNLLATAQNICIVLLDQNYQLLNMTAQSGGTTPANSSCATPPVITLSDGTRSATMTMTSGKAAWNSGVDAVTNINQVFASGATLTVSIGANTCATPPANVSVNYNLQSVLNP